MEDDAYFFVRFDDEWLCHVNFDNLISISKMKKDRGLAKLKNADNTMCKQCQLGKMTKSSFKRKTYTSQEVL